MIGAALALFLMFGSGQSNIAVSPVMVQTDKEKDPLEYGYRNFATYISELFGTFMFVFLFMISTDKKTQFSEDKVVNCFIISASYVAARLMAGGKLSTVLYTIKEGEDYKGGYLNRYNPADLTSRRLIGPLLNPALAFGQMTFSGSFSFIF